MAFKIRRGTNAERLTITPAQGELIFTTDTKRLFVGDGTTQGGVAVTDLTAYATTAYVDGQISNLIGPNILTTLDTLKELSSAIDNDPNFFQTIRNEISDKINNDNLATLSNGDTYVTKNTTTVSLGQKASQNVTVGPSGIQIVGTGGVTIQGAATAGILIGGGTSGPVSFQSQTLGISYNDLNNKPTIPAAQVNSDWTATTGVAAILNKPTDLATQTYVDNKISDLVNGAGPALDTLKELADALGNDSSFASNLTTTLSNKADTSALWDRTTITDNLIPDSDITYDLGSPTNRFKDLYLSNNTLYLGDDAISVDGVYGLSLKQPGGGEGYGAGSVAWTDQSTLIFSGVEVAHPLYGYLEKLTKGDKIKELAPGDADFTITVTGSLQFGPNVGGFVDVTVPVDQPKSQNNVGGNYYVYVVEFIKPVNNFNNLENSPLVENSSGWYDIDPNANKSIGLQNIVGDGTIYVRPSWDRTPTVDFQFKENGTIQLPAGGDIVDSAGVSVLGGGGPANTGNITFTDNTIGSTGNIVDISVSDYAQLNSNDSFVWVDNAGAHVEVNGGEGGREFIFNSDSRSLRAQLQMPQGAKINFGADATALGAPDSSGSTDKIRLWDFQGSNPSGYNYAIGAEGGGIWFSTDVNNGTGGFSFYSQNNRKFKIRDDGTVDLYNHILPDDNNIIDLGSENTKFRNVYAAGVTQSHKRATSCPVNVDTVVYTATAQYQHAIKIFAMVEGNVDGEGSNWHTQACDIIAVRSYNNNTVFVTTYGVTYTSTAAFATFDGQWNATTNRIEITCRPVSTNNNVVVSIHATEITSQD